jgi:hypothetical protein
MIVQSIKPRDPIKLPRIPKKSSCRWSTKMNRNPKFLPRWKFPIHSWSRSLAPGWEWCSARYSWHRRYRSNRWLRQHLDR